MPVLYHQAPVAHSAKVLIVLAEKGLAFDCRRIDPPCGSQDPDILNASHAGSVPVLVTDDGAAIGESSTIAEYIDDTHPEVPLMPRDAVGRWRARVWFKFVNEDLAPATSVLAWNAWGRPGRDEAALAAIPPQLEALPQDRQAFWFEAFFGFGNERVDHARQKIAMVVGLIEARLLEFEYLAGDTYSLADIDVWPFASVLPELVPDLAGPGSAPKMHEWIEKVAQRPAVRSVTAEAAKADWLPGPEPIRWG